MNIQIKQQESGMLIPEGDYDYAEHVDPQITKQAIRQLKLLRACPHTVRQILEAGDEAIDLAGLSPWCVNEGLASGDELHTHWSLDQCIEHLESLLPEEA